MAVNKHSVMKAWVEGFLSGNEMSFENIEAIPGFRAFVPEYGEYQISQDITGTKTKQYTFGFVAIETLDRYDMETNNSVTRQGVDDFNDWLVLQQKNKNFPNFGSGVTNYKIVPLQNTANMAQVFEDNSLAKYVLMARIEYKEKE